MKRENLRKLALVPIVVMLVFMTSVHTIKSFRIASTDVSGVVQKYKKAK